MNTFKISLSPTKFVSKPTGTDTKKLTFKTTDLSIKNFADAIASGQTFAPAIFTNEKRSNANFINTQVFALDFDDNQNVNEKIQLFANYNINVNFAYYTFSHTEKFNKFRFVIILDRCVDDRKLRDKIMQALMDISLDCDPACKDAARIFFGSNRTVEILHKDFNVVDDILPALDTFINLNVSEPTKRINVKNLKNFQNAFTPYIYIERERKMKENETTTTQQHYNYLNACEVSPVLNSFFKGENLKYRTLFALATNMNHIKGGIKWMRDCMDRSGTYKPEDYEMIQGISRYNYLPSNIKNFDVSLIGLHNSLLTIDKARQGVEVVIPIVKEDPNDIFNKFSHEMNKISNRQILETYGKNIPKINILKAGVGIGKTKLIMNQKNVIIALPNHKLKNELSLKMCETNSKFLVTPELPKFNDTKINNDYLLSHKIGDGFRANEIIKNKAMEVPGEDENVNEDIFLAAEYLRQNKLCYNSDRTVLTTHSKLLLAGDLFKNKDHYIFDEDIIFSLLPIVNFKRGDLIRIIKDVEKSNYTKSFIADLKAVYNYIVTLPISIIKPVDSIVFLNEKLFKKIIILVSGGEKLLRFLNSDFVIRTIGMDDVEYYHAIKKNELPSDKQITIVSGTADKWLYDKILKGRDFDFLNLGTAKNITPVTQYTGVSYSKNKLNKSEIPEVNDNSIVITYKDYKMLFPTADDIVHFGNTSGFDHLKGKNITVVGTPINPQVITMLYAKALNLDFVNQERENRRVTIEGHSFDMLTYTDDNLMNIEIRIVKMELEQAAGRARGSRTDAQIEIFSKVPADSSDIFKIKKT